MSKRLNFTKMHGCGNDYIYINCFDSFDTFDTFCKETGLPGALAVRLTDRHTGVGGDGLVLILPSDKADAQMRMFNADGSEAGMCGNAIRCVGKYLYDNGIVKKTRMNIDTRTGIKELYLTISNGAANGGTVSSVRVDMGPAELHPGKVPVDLPGENVIARPVTISGLTYEITCVLLGNPNVVVFCEDVDRIDLLKVGPLFENDPLFPERVNAEFIEVLSRDCLKMRVWERGSGVTLACGTGACAAVVAAVLNGFCDKNADITVRLPGGNLVINYTGETVYMTGNCVKVFDGTVEI